MSRPGRLTEEQRRALHEAIRTALREHYRPTEIRKYLTHAYPDDPLFSMSERTLYRHLGEIREENRRYLDELAKGEFTDDWRNSKEILEDCVRSLIVIRESMDLTPKEKMARVNATMAIAQIEGAVINLTAKGPLVWSIQNRFREPWSKKLGGPSKTPGE